MRSISWSSRPRLSQESRLVGFASSALSKEARASSRLPRCFNATPRFESARSFFWLDLRAWSKQSTASSSLPISSKVAPLLFQARS